MNNLEDHNLEQRDDELNRQIEKHPAEESIQVLVKDAHRSKRRMRILTVSVILDILLTIGLAAVSFKTSELAHLAQSNKNAVIANCETANESRKNNRDLWEFAFTLTPEQPPTPEQAERTAKFKEFVAKTFAERNCQAETNIK